MITLSKTGSSIVFEFDDNSTYLNNGTISVPVNSLALIIDQSDMATFRKSASNDIFVSANIAEFGMTKAELEEWYAENMVGSTGGGGGGDITSGEVQTMIDAAVSGKADTTAVTADIAAAVSGKADISDIPSVTGYADSVKYNSDSHYVEFYHNGTGGTKVFEYDASPFIIDGMVENVEIKTLSGTSYLVVSFNTDAGKQDINIPLTDIFDPSNYYTTAQTNNAINAAVSGKADTTAVTAVNDVLTAHTANTNIHVTSEEKTAWNAKSDFSGSYNDLTDKPTIPTVPTDVSAFNNDAGYITADAISGKADVSAITAIESAMTEDEEVTAAALNNLQENKADTTAVTASINAAVSGKADTTAVTAVNDVLTAHTANTNIHVTSSDKSTWSGKQDALVSGTNIKTINNESILGSGNITISGGSGGNANIVEVTKAEYDALVSGGTVDPDAMYVITDATEINMSGYAQTSAVTAEITAAVSGKADTTALANYVPNSAVTTAVTSASTNNEIPSALAVYAATSGVGTNYTAGNGIDITSDVISVTGKVDSSAVVTAITSASTDSQIASAKCVYNQLGGLKLMQITQAEYDALVQGGTVDASTVYIIVN